MFQTDHKRALLAILLSGLVLFSWQYYMGPKANSTPTVQVKENETKNENNKVETKSTTENQATNTTPTAVISNFNLKTENSSYEFSSDLTLKNATNKNALVEFPFFSGSDSPIKIQLLSEQGLKDLNIAKVNSTDTHFEGRDEQNDVSFISHLNADGKLTFALNSKTPHRYRFTFKSSEKKLDNGQVRNFIVYENETKTFAVNKAKQGDGTYKWLGVDFDYHLLALVFKDKQVAKYESNEQGALALETVTPSVNFESSLVFTKKNYDHLLTLGDGLHLSVDFGFFAILAVPLLRGLQFLYKYIPNYGIAIILLTILIRLITFPLQYKSFKSMKKMQAIQPELQAIKEKYKDDSMKMQKETMDLFKRAGANPLSGCLPLLLQMPFFFAIYRVLYSAVELVGAPFGGWIHDLSIHDPFYVLPVLMAASMFLQQKITPQTSVDPNQQKIMMLMPLIFGFIMKNLPAGLVLYIFVSTSVGILQQYLVYKAID